MGGSGDRALIRFDSDVSGLLAGIRAIDEATKQLASSSGASFQSLPGFTPPPQGTTLTPQQVATDVGTHVGVRRQETESILRSQGSTDAEIKSELSRITAENKVALQKTFQSLGVAENEVIAALKSYVAAIAQVTRKTSAAASAPGETRSRGEIAAAVAYPSTEQSSTSTSQPRVAKAKLTAEQEAAKEAEYIKKKAETDRRRAEGEYHKSQDTELRNKNATAKTFSDAEHSEFKATDPNYRAATRLGIEADRKQGIARDEDERAANGTSEARRAIARNEAQNALFVKEQALASQQHLRMLLQNNDETRKVFGQEQATREANLGIIKAARATAFKEDPSLRKDVVAGKVGDSREAAIQSSDVEGALNADKAYIKARGEATAFTASTNAKVAAQSELLLSADGEYIKARGEAAASAASNSARSNAIKESALAADEEYLKAKTAEARGAAIRAAKEQEGLLGDETYLRAKAEAATTQKVINTKIQAISEAALAADTEYIRYRTELSAATALRVSREQIALAESYQKNPQLATQVGAGRAASDAVRAAEELATLKARLSDPSTTKTEGEGVAARKAVEQQRNIAAEKALAIDQSYLVGAEELLVLQNQRKRGEAVAAGTAQVLESRAALELQNLQNARAYAAETAVGTAVGDQMIAARIETLTLTKLTNAALEREQAGNPEFLAAKAAETVAREQLSKALFEEANKLRVSKGLSPVLPPAGQDAFSQKSKSIFGNFLGGGLATTVKYAAPSAVLFGAASGISNSIKEANELNVELARLQGQFEATFGSDSQEELKKFKEGILESARATGTPAQDVADISRQLQGAFGPDTGVSIKNTEGASLSGEALVNDQKDAVLQLMKVIGIAKQEAVDAGTAISLSFGVTARAVGDVTQKLEDLTGVRAKDTFSAIADSAPAAKEAGYSLEEYAALITVINQKSGRSGTAISESLNRILPEVTKNKAALLELSAQEDALNNKPFLEAIGTGKAKNVLDQIGASFDKLSKQGQDLVVQLLGGQKNAKDLIPALQSDAQRRDLVVKISDGGSADALQKRFDSVMDTLQEKFNKIKELARQLGITLLEGGLNDALKDAVDLVEVLVKAFGGAFTVVGKINSLMGSIPVRLGEVILLAKTLQGIFNKMANTSALKGVISQLGTAGGGVKKGEQVGVGILARITGRGAAAATPAAEMGTAITGAAVTGAASMAEGIVAGATTAAGILAAGTAEGAVIGGGAEAGLGRLTQVGKTGTPFFLPAATGIAGETSAVAAGAGAGGAASVAGGTTAFGAALPLLAVAGTVLAIKTYFDARKAVNEANEKTFKELKKRKYEDIDSADIDGNSVADFFRENLLGGESSQELKDRAKRAVKSRDNTKNLDFLREQTKIKNSDIVAAATGGRDIEGFVAPIVPVGNTLPVAGRVGDKTYDAQDEQGNKWSWSYSSFSWQLIELGPLPSEDKKRGKKSAKGVDGGLAKNKNLKEKIGVLKERPDLSSVAQILGVDIGFSTDVPDVYLGTTQGMALSAQRQGAQELIDKLSKDEKQQFIALANRVKKAVARTDGAKNLDSDQTAAAEAKALELLLRGKIEEVEKEADKGDVGAVAALDIYNRTLQEDPVFVAARKAAEAKLNLVEGLGKATGNSSAVQLEELLKAYETGDTTSATVIANFDGITAAYQTYLDLAKSQGQKPDADIMAAMQKNIAAKAKFYAEVVKKRNELSREINDLSGRSGADTAQETILQDLANLRDPNFTDKQARYDTAKELVQAQRTRFEQMIADAKTAQEAYAIMQQGFEIPQEVREALITEQLNDNQGFADFAEKYKLATGKTAEGLVANIVALYNAGQAGKQQVQAVLNAELTPLLTKLQADQAEYQKLNDSLQVRQKANPNARGTVATPEEQQAILDQRGRIAAGQDAINALEGLITDSSFVNQITVPPTKGGATPQDLEKARKAAENEKKKDKKLVDDQRNAYIALLNAVNGSGSAEALVRNIEEAQRDINDARSDLASATTLEERAAATVTLLNAMQAKVEAQRAQRSHLRDLQNAENDYLLAVVEGTGDTVRIAQMGQEKAQKTLQDMIDSKNQGLGDYTDVDLASQRAAVVRASTGVRDAQYKKANDDIDFNLTMGRITKQQAIGQLNAQRALYANNESITREIDRKIHELEGQVNSEFKFNIPKLLSLTTQYEVRRLDQQTSSAPASVIGGNTTSSSVGYQDNRKIVLTLVSNSPAEEARMMAIIGDAVGNSRNGMDVRRY